MTDQMIGRNVPFIVSLLIGTRTGGPGFNSNNPGSEKSCTMREVLLRAPARCLAGTVPGMKWVVPDCNLRDPFPTATGNGTDICTQLGLLARGFP